MKKFIALMGPDASGKTSLAWSYASMSKAGGKYLVPAHLCRSATTRPRREGEGNTEYDFVTNAVFLELQRAEELLETQTSRLGIQYGLLRPPSDVEVGISPMRLLGVGQLIDKGIDVFRCLVLPGSSEEQGQRLVERGVSSGHPPLKVEECYYHLIVQAGRDFNMPTTAPVNRLARAVWKHWGQD